MLSISVKSETIRSFFDEKGVIQNLAIWAIDEMWFRSDEPLLAGQAARTWNCRTSSACCVTASESLKTASLPSSFWVSGLLFLAMLFAAAAVAAFHLSLCCHALRVARLGNDHFRPRCHLRDHEPLCGQEMAAVFMISTSTLAILTGIIARWIEFVGYAFATASPAERVLY
jgi:hypothetical protein